MERIVHKGEFASRCAELQSLGVNLLLRLTQVVGQAANFALAVDAGDRAAGLHDNFHIGNCGRRGSGPRNFVGMFDPHATAENDAGGQREQVVENGGTQILDLHLGHDQHESAVFEIAVTVAARAQQFHAATLKIVQVLRMMHATLAVGFVVANSN